jgi:transcriptional regulator with XRE-family HTH domain
MSLYDRIDMLCKANGTKITVLERELGFGRGSIGKLKNGKTKAMSSDRVKKVAEYFGVTVDSLTDDDAVHTDARRIYYTDEETEGQAQELSDDQHAVMQAIPHLPPQRVKILRAMLEEWKDTNPNG